MALLTMHAVESSNIASVGHDGTDLHVTFKSGGTHRYKGVPVETFDAMRIADSVGKFFHANIRKQFETEKVEPEKPAEEPK